MSWLKVGQIFAQARSYQSSQFLLHILRSKLHTLYAKEQFLGLDVPTSPAFESTCIIANDAPCYQSQISSQRMDRHGPSAFD